MKETHKAKQAFTDYVALGPERSLAKLAEQYQRQADGGEAVPTKYLRTIEKWSSEHDWQSRVDNILLEQFDDLAEELKSHERAILKSGYALAYERVAVLKELADTLRSELAEMEKRWPQNAKALGDGEIFYYRQFNEALMRQFRGLLDDIAKELGDRAEGLKLIGEDGGPPRIEVVEVVRSRPRDGDSSSSTD